MIKGYIPKPEDLYLREKLLNDGATMSYNLRWGGVIAFPRDVWAKWYDYWIVNASNERYYSYLINDNNEFIGEIAYHYDGKCYLANIIIHAKYRNKGYGKEGLILLCKIAKENGIKELYDDIAIDNPAISLFLECGFVEEYRNNEIVMVKKCLKI